MNSLLFLVMTASAVGWTAATKPSPPFDLGTARLSESEGSRRLLAISAMMDTDFGVPQDIGPAGGGPLAVKSGTVLRKSKAYIHDLYASDDHGLVHVRDACINRHEKCSEWAAVGLCEANSPFTGMYCCPACRSAELLDPAKRCPPDPDAEAVWSEPGQLDAMFERVVESYVGRGAKVLSRPPSGPWVVSIDDFLSSDECDRLIAHGHAEGYYHSVESPEQYDGNDGNGVTDVFTQGRVSEVRTSSNAWCEGDCESDPDFDGVLDRVFGDLLGGVHRKHSEYLQLLRYQQGQAYGEHHDFMPFEVDRPAGPRVLTVYLYLNDMDAVDPSPGGETRFPHLGNLTVTPQRGRALLWPNVLDGQPDVRDDRTVHEAVEVRRGEKYGANLWVHQRDFRGPMERYCHL